MIIKIDKNTERRILTYFEKYEVSEDLYDWKSDWDNKISNTENLNVIFEKIRVLSDANSFEAKVNGDLKTKRKTIKSEKDEKERTEFQNFKKEEENTEKEFNKAIKSINPSNRILNEIYKIPREYVKVICNNNNDLNGLLFLGSQGSGKSFGTLQILNEMKTKYVYHSGFTTPLRLFLFLYEHKEKDITIIFDDNYGLMNTEAGASILLSALYSSSNKREVSWDSSSGRLKDTPTKFIFEAKLILITNVVPKKLSSDLIKSRCLTYTFNFTNKQFLFVMKAISQLPSKRLSKTERTRVFNFIKYHVNEATENFDLRVQQKIENLFLYDKENWKDLSYPLLNAKDENMVLIKKFLLESSTIKEAEAKWNEETGKSRRTFYYNKAKLR